ncbi:hypothetical protein RI367_004354 [Sorochytrium milnesiophthora]
MDFLSRPPLPSRSLHGNFGLGETTAATATTGMQSEQQQEQKKRDRNGFLPGSIFYAAGDDDQHTSSSDAEPEGSNSNRRNSRNSIFDVSFAPIERPPSPSPLQQSSSSHSASDGSRVSTESSRNAIFDCSFTPSSPPSEQQQQQTVIALSPPGQSSPTRARSKHIPSPLLLPITVPSVGLSKKLVDESSSMAIDSAVTMTSPTRSESGDRNHRSRRPRSLTVATSHPFELQQRQSEYQAQEFNARTTSPSKQTHDRPASPVSTLLRPHSPDGSRLVCYRVDEQHEERHQRASTTSLVSHTSGSIASLRAREEEAERLEQQARAERDKARPISRSLSLQDIEGGAGDSAEQSLASEAITVPVAMMTTAGVRSSDLNLAGHRRRESRHAQHGSHLPPLHPPHNPETFHLTLLPTRRNFLGEGLYATVYRGYYTYLHTHFEAECAVKLLKEDDNGEAQMSGLTEACMLKLLRGQSNIVRIIDVVDTNADTVPTGRAGFKRGGKRLTIDLLTYPPSPGLLQSSIVCEPSFPVSPTRSSTFQDQPVSPSPLSLTPPRYALVLEYCSAGSLWRHVQSNSRGIGRRLWMRWARQLAKAVEFVHARRIVHHDIKPHNILLADSDFLTPKLSDFGTALPIPDSGYFTVSDGIGRGTLSYTAPELLSAPPSTLNNHHHSRDHSSHSTLSSIPSLPSSSSSLLANNSPHLSLQAGYYTSAIDIYALGATLIAIGILGCDPFHSITNPVKTIMAIQRGFFKSPDNYPSPELHSRLADMSKDRDVRAINLYTSSPSGSAPDPHPPSSSSSRYSSTTSLKPSRSVDNPHHQQQQQHQYAIVPNTGQCVRFLNGDLVDKPVWDLLQECVHKDPEMRPTAAELVSRLRELDGGELAELEL